MSRHRVKLGTLTIPSGQQESNILAAEELSMATALIFYNPAAFTGTVAVEVAAEMGALAAAHLPLDNNGTAVTLTAGRAQRHQVNGFRSVMLDSDINEGAARAVDVYAVLDVPS